jgi:hypothetical protein
MPAAGVAGANDMAAPRWLPIALGLLTILPGSALALSVAGTAPAASGSAAEALNLAAGQAPAFAGVLQDTADLQQALDAYRAELAPEQGFAHQLLVAGVQRADIALPAPRDVTFDEATRALYNAAGIAAPPDIPAPRAEVAQAAAPVILATAIAGQLAQQALAPLGAEEQAFLWQHLALLAGAPPQTEAERADRARAEQLAGKADMSRMVLGAAVLADSLERFPRDLVPQPSAENTVFVDFSGLIQINDGTGIDVNAVPRLLIIDLGGNDVYMDRVGSYGPGAGQPLPVAAILDLGGSDRYQTTTLSNGVDAAWAQGAGIGGIALIVDVQGSDQYTASLTDNATTCSGSWLAQLLFAQGAGLLGVGGILDVTGNDVYVARNVNDIEDDCHWGWAYTFAQGAGVFLGVGLLADGSGDDRYDAYSQEQGKWDNVAQTMAQGAAAGGAGVLADAGGRDKYSADSLAQFGMWRNKGAFAYTFAQGATLGTGRTLNPLLGSLCVNTNPFSACIPALGSVPGIALLASACRLQSPGSPTCDLPGVGVLLDVGGRDSMYANARTSDRDLYCSWASWAVASGQGSAAFGGLAALLRAQDAFDGYGIEVVSLTATAEARGCQVLGVRAHTYGQGYGGPLMWDTWDVPGPLPYFPQNPIGLNGGVGVSASIGKELLGTGDDQYFARSESIQGDSLACSTVCESRAENRVQGASADGVDGGFGRTYKGAGVGVNLDVVGTDDYRSYADAQAWPTFATNGYNARNLAQGASAGGLAVFANVRGSDSYDAQATENLVLLPIDTVAQGEVGGGIVPPVAVFVDLMGWDTYSEVGTTGCQSDGTLLPWTWGSLPGCTFGGITALGLDWLSNL